MTPAWGTPPPPVTRYTVVGFYEASGQRFVEHRSAVDARAAEDQVMREFGGQVGEDGVSCGLRVCGVLAVVGGEIKSMDSYATFLDPDEQP